MLARVVTCMVFVSAVTVTDPVFAQSGADAHTSVPFPAIAATRSPVGEESNRQDRTIDTRGDQFTADRVEEQRPAVLIPLYVSLVGLQGADIASTLSALDSGRGREANPLVAPVAGNVGAMIALKSASTGLTIFAMERLWRKNRAAAILTMIGVNVAYGVIVANNVRVAGR